MAKDVRSTKQEIQSLRFNKLPAARAMLSRLQVARKELMQYGENDKVRNLIQAIDNGEQRESSFIPDRNYRSLPVIVDLHGWDGRSLSTYSLDVEILEAKLEALTASLPSEDDIASAQSKIDKLSADISPVVDEYNASFGVILAFLSHTISLLNKQAARRLRIKGVNDLLIRESESVDIPCTIFRDAPDEVTNSLLNLSRQVVHAGGVSNDTRVYDRAVSEYEREHGPIKAIESGNGNV